MSNEPNTRAKFKAALALIERRIAAFNPSGSHDRMAVAGTPAECALVMDLMRARHVMIINIDRIDSAITSMNSATDEIDRALSDVQSLLAALPDHPSPTAQVKTSEAA